MAVISVATTKGGVGKSTTVANVAVVAWAAGANVAVFDCDPQRHSKKMVDKLLARFRAEAPDKIKERGRLDIFEDATQDNLLDRLGKANDAYDLVLVDLQGSANQMMLLAMSEADLVILPVQPSELDIDGALAAWAQVVSASRVSRRKIASRIFFVRTPAAIQPKVLRSTRQTFEQKGLSVMQTEFIERIAFKELTFNGKFPTEYAPESGAAKNVRAIYAEILSTLKQVMEEAA